MNPICLLVLTGNTRSIWILVGDLHMFHECLTSEEEFVTDWTACCIGPSNKSRMLLEHNTLLQLLFCFAIIIVFFFCLRSRWWPEVVVVEVAVVVEKQPEDFISRTPEVVPQPTSTQILPNSNIYEIRFFFPRSVCFFFFIDCFCTRSSRIGTEQTIPIVCKL